jgi:hypothetical protein
MKRLAVLVMLLSAAAGVTLVAQVQTRLFGIGANITPAEAFFSDAKVQEVRLAVTPQDWQALKDDFGSNTYYTADFRWGNAVIRNIGIRSRGSGSRSGTKPGLRVDFDRYADQTFLGLKSFILRNNTQDPSNMHERLAMQMYKHMGLPAPREAFAKLYINDQYVGLYTIVESVDKRSSAACSGRMPGISESTTRTIRRRFRTSMPGARGRVGRAQPVQPATHESDPMGEMIEQWLTASTSRKAGFDTSDGRLPGSRQSCSFWPLRSSWPRQTGSSATSVYRTSMSTTRRRASDASFRDRSESFKGGVQSSIFHNLFNVTTLNHLAGHTLEYRITRVLKSAPVRPILRRARGRAWRRMDGRARSTTRRDAARAVPSSRSATTISSRP